MSNNIGQKTLLVGAGLMAIDYANVLVAQHVLFDVVGRGQGSAATFKEKTGVPVYTGGLEQYFKENGLVYPSAIVAVSVEQLAQTTILLLEKGFKRVLVEKPAGLNRDQIKEVARVAEKNNAEVYVAYNRRFYASTQKAQEIIDEDGGVLSFNFEFTEWSHVIEDLEKASGVKEQWFLANSTHVADLAFYLAGKPKELVAYTAGGLSWHPSASIYAGAGVSEQGALFSYQANWEAPGRWRVEVLTSKHRLVFCPMEQLHIQRIGTVSVEMVQLDDELDRKFKPGLYQQVQVFLGDEKKGLLDIAGQYAMVKNCYETINGKG
ncbi:MAG: Gfo/Idh/MocA family oxidoreductase [Desulfitobacterium hafniense]|nr:Gfo/Idh/MocA family oxidoreductase [Desulfitobacterium hafniense]